MESKLSRPIQAWRSATARTPTSTTQDLVLLDPFLPRFFEYTKLWDEGRWVSPAAAHRAAGLLQWVVTGDEQPLEHQVTLNKVLCGLEPGTVFDFGDPLTDDEMDKCEDLIFAVLEHFLDAVGEVTLDGLRTEYLPRRGVLSAGPASWLLRVERKDGDGRLDGLPWSFRNVMLPSREHPLQVEW